ncbi:hypothetical protein PCI56_26840 [Plesiomonas shigelloides subsp. oncorhynchi]|nr:hypothetical protein [Plesiomonas shigelloides]
MEGLNKTTSNNGTEFTSKVMFFWSKEVGIGLVFSCHISHQSLIELHAISLNARDNKVE